MSDPTTDGDGPRTDATPEGRRQGGTYRLLFVCSGNTCRSPMAEAITRDILRTRGWEGFEVRSAGAGAFPGSPPSGGAVRAAAARGIDLADHRATLLTRREVEWADLILTMSRSHLMRVSDLGGGGRAALLPAYAEGRETAAETEGIPDPVGSSDREYDKTYERLEELVEKVLLRLEPEARR
ncbi:MAG: low molecular weight protein arginine phosphatase [Gemmatimonadota bacterium]|nr:low molecular weight protein arginine phosphatase [Gemmatimonadota bacterium]